MAGKGFSVFARLVGKDLASGPLVKGLGKVRVAGLATKKVLGGVFGLAGKVLAYGGLGGIGGALGIGGAIYGVKRLVTGWSEATDEQSKFARQNRITISTLQEMEYAAKREGLSVEGLRMSFEGLNFNVGQMAAGRGRALKFLSAIRGGREIARDLTHTTDAMQAMEIALDAIRRSPTVQRKAAMARALGLDENIVRLAARSRAELEALRAEMRRYGTDTQASGQAAEDFQDAQERLEASLLGLQRTIGATVAPKLTEYTDKISEWLTGHKTDVAAWAEKGLKALESFVAYLPTLVDNLEKVGAALAPIGHLIIKIGETVQSLFGVQETKIPEGVTEEEWAGAQREVLRRRGLDRLGPEGVNKIQSLGKVVGVLTGAPINLESYGEEVMGEVRLRRMLGDLTLPEILRRQSVSGTVRLEVSAAPGVAVRMDEPDIEGPIEFVGDVGQSAAFYTGGLQ